MDTEKIGEIERKIQYAFKNKQLLEQAFTHSSYGNQEHVADNERMEFLGDAVLGYITSQYLFESFKDRNEGDLSAMRARLVSADNLSKIVDKLGLVQYLQIVSGPGANCELSRKTEANLFEAVLSAIYLDGGLSCAREFVLRAMGNSLINAVDTLKKDAKTLVQEYCQKRRYTVQYLPVERSGPDNNPTFKYELHINGKAESVGEGKSKKTAEQDAASKIVEKWRIE